MLLVVVVIAIVIVIAGVIALVAVRVPLVPPHLPVLVAVVVADAGRSSSDRRASGNGVAGDRHGGLREGVTVERSTSEGDGRTGEDGPDELRIRHRHGFGDPPEHAIARRWRARPRDHREAGTRQGAGPQRPDLEYPEPVCR